MAESTALVAVAGGETYVRYAEQLMESAREFFHPTSEMLYVILDGEEGWPIGTLCRHERLLAGLPKCRYIYLCDADMRFESHVGNEVLPSNHGLVATLHPGYVTTPAHDLPYERDPVSACAILDGSGGTYYCGGFFGGQRMAVRSLLQRTCGLLAADAASGHVPRFHDESALNRVLTDWTPQLVLDPGFCYPDADEFYRRIWPTSYKRVLVALDKTREERGDR